MMVSIMVLILVVILSNPLRHEIARSRNTSQYLNASDPDITVVHRATTSVLDLTLFYFIATLIGASVAFISGRKTFTQVVTAIMVFVVVSILITPLKTLIILARDSSHLDCTNAAITVGGKLSCIFVDVWLFYFVVACIFAAVTYIFIKTTKAT